MKYYHNKRCAKSREGLALLQEQGHEPEIVLYMEEALSVETLRGLLRKLNINAEALVRTQEALWKEEYRDKELSEEEILYAMLEEPRLMQRPILETEERAAVGRPPEALLSIL